MEPRQAAQTLEVIRTLMERTCQYQLLTARAGLAAGSPSPVSRPRSGRRDSRPPPTPRLRPADNARRVPVA